MKQLIIAAFVVVFGIGNMVLLVMSGPKLDPKPSAPLAPQIGRAHV